MDKQVETGDTRPKCGRCGQPIEGEPAMRVRSILPVGGIILVPIDVPVCANCRAVVSGILAAEAMGAAPSKMGRPLYRAWGQGKSVTVAWNR